MKASKFVPLLIVVALAACGKKTETSEPAAATPPVVNAPVAAPEAPVITPAPAPAPAAPAATASAPAATASAPAGGDLAKGEQIYAANCVSCHGAGVLGAPKFGDKAAWQPRIAKGNEALHTSALNGFKTMPPKGGNAALKDDEVKAAVDYMVSKAI